MYSRLLTPPKNKSFFLFGPRGTGKTFWVKSHFKEALYLDLLEVSLFTDLLANPSKLELLIPKGFKDWIIIDEVQKIPDLLNEVHRLIEKEHYKFVLTGSSARQLRKKGVNLLAGRALTYSMHPLTAIELGKDFDLRKALYLGGLPSIQQEEDPKRYLDAYVATYLKEEVLQEGLTRNLGAFSRFLEAASFSQAGMLNVSEVARECAVERKSVENYFHILDDLMLSVRLPAFTKRAKRRIVSHPKFYFFDVGVYRAMRPLGPLDSPEEIGGLALETLFFQNLRAINDYYDYGYELFYWRTSTHMEVDFIAYGAKEILAFEVKRSVHFHLSDLKGLEKFSEEYPMAKLYLIYGGSKRLYHNKIEVIPIEEALFELPNLLKRE